MFIGGPFTFAATLLTDTFTGTTIDPAKWTVVDSGANITQNDSLAITNSFSATWGATAVYSVDTFPRDSLSVVATMTPASGAQLLGYGDYNFQAAGTKAYIIDLPTTSGAIYALSWENGALVNSNFGCGTLTSGAAYKLSVTVTGFDVLMDTGGGFVSQCSLTAETSITNKPIFLESGSVVSYFDDLTVTGAAVMIGTVADLTAGSMDGGMLLNWTAPSTVNTITDYVIQYRVYGASTWTTFDDGTSAAATATVTGLTNGNRYEFNVEAITSDGTGLSSNNPNSRPMGVLFSDTFDSLTTAAIAGQNGWQAVGTGTWTVAAGNGGKVVNQTDAVATFTTNQISNGQSAWVNERVKVDFLEQSGDNHQLWVRKTAATGNGGGYLLHHADASSWYLLKHAADDPGNTTLTTASYALTNGVWYTMEFEAINNASGDPLLQAYIYPVGGTRGAPFMTYTDSSSPFASGYAALGINAVTGSYDNFYAYGTSNDAIAITTPSRSVSASPQTATISITDEGGTFKIPYIQTSTTLAVAATVGSTVLPAGGGVKFILNEGQGSEQSLYDMSSPFTASFTGLAKGTYTLDAHVVNSSQVVQTGAGNQDTATNIGIGDIFTAIGDSITEGYYGTDYGATAVTNWLDAPAGSLSADNRNFAQYGPTSATYKKSWMPELNDELTTYYGYPVFIMNDGWGGYKATDYITLMGTAQWQNRQTALIPNKWLLHLGVNDGIAGVTPTNFQSQMQTIMNTLVSTYGAASSSIWLAKPSYSNVYTYTENYLPNIVTLRNSNALGGGPDFWNYYLNHIALYGGDPVHPNTAGMTQMARLWAISIMSPKNLTASQVTNTVQLTWNDLSTVDATIAGYKVKYGTSPGTYTTTVDVGNVTSKTVAGLTAQTYYFTVSAYDNDATTMNETPNATEVSLAFDLAGPTVSAVTATPNASGAGIVWTTNELASSMINYGLTTAYGTTSTEANTAPRVTSHSVSLAGLLPCTTYHFRPRSNDAYANLGTGSDGTFTTTGCTGSAAVTASNSADITTAAGGTVDLLSGATGITLTVPAAFSGSDANFQINQLDSASVLATAPAPSGFSAIGSYMYSLQALSGVSTAITSFDNPITVRIAYASADVTGIDESTLRIYRWNGSAWSVLTGCSVNEQTNTVTCTTTQFSTFGLFGQATAAVTRGGGDVSAPQAPMTGFSIAVNSNAASTTSTAVMLTLIGGPDTATMAISNSADFMNVPLETYASTKSWNLCTGLSVCSTGNHSVYVRFYTASGGASGTYTDTILFTLGSPATEVPAAPSSPTGSALLENLQRINVPVHARIKAPDNAAVYYVGTDGKRHAFPNESVYFTWYANFSGIQIMSASDLASIPLGENVTYKPGVRLVKFLTDPKVYAVASGGILRWITSELIAATLYGPDWNQMVDDINDVLYGNYVFGSNVISPADYDPATATASVQYPGDGRGF